MSRHCLDICLDGLSQDENKVEAFGQKHFNYCYADCAWCCNIGDFTTPYYNRTSVIYVGESHSNVYCLFISPMCAVAVALGTTIGFLVSGATPVIVWRAFSHIIFAVLGGWWLYRHPHTVQSPLSRNVFSFVLGLVHVICEIAVVSFFFLGGALSEAYYTYGYWITVLGLVGVGGLVHSMIDFEIAWIIVRGLRRMKELENLFLSSGK